MTDVLIVGSTTEFDPAARVWGTGGWRSPEEREALDWLTLVRCLGWRVRTATRVSTEARPDVVVVAAPIETAEATAGLLGWARAGTLVVAPHDHLPSDLQVGVTLGYNRHSEGAARVAWESSRPFTVAAPRFVTLLPQPPARSWMTINDEPVIALCPHGDGLIAVLGFRPSSARDASSTFSTALVDLLTTNAPVPTAWLDHSGTVVLRMDDPGGAQNIYSKDWCYRKLTSGEWRQIGESLARRNASMSVAYSAGFVDDGDAGRGRLLVGGHEVPREPGRIHPSPEVHYEDVGGHAPGTSYDYSDEFEGISGLLRDGTATVELHGYTHLHPDRAAWAGAPDRYESVSWYRELGAAAASFLETLPRAAHPLSLSQEAVRSWFGREPTTLVCPGEEWTNDALHVALELGLSLVGSYYLALRHENRFCWSTHICSPYLDEPHSTWFDSPLPVVGYMHDRDLVVYGVRWLDDCLRAWSEAGARRFTDYRDLAALIRTPLRVREADDRWVIEMGDRSLVPRPGFRIGLRTGDQRPVMLSVCGESSGVMSSSDPGTRWIEASPAVDISRST